MAMVVKCPNPKCGKPLSVPQELAGRRVKCNACGEAFVLPGPTGPAGAEGPTVLLRSQPSPKPDLPAEASAKAGTPDPKLDPLIGAKIAHYRLQSLLGKGGMGKVYKAHNTSLDKTCAIKILPPEFAEQDESAISRFVREARAAAKIEHANVLPVWFVGKVGEHYFIEMQYVDGGTLEGLLKRKGRLPVKEAAEIVRDVAAGLQAAHEKGIIHRDMKPTNVMLTSKGHVYVMDFGLAKVAHGRTGLTVSGTIMGTPLYMSPEQAMAQPVDHRSDIYSLGVMFYQIVAGTPPFDADTAMALIAQHVHAPAPDLAQVAPDAPPQIAQMIQRMMAKNPADRYQSCAEIVQELNGFLTAGASAPTGPTVVVPEETLREASDHRRSVLAQAKRGAPSRVGLKLGEGATPKKRSAMPVVFVLVLLLVLVLGAVVYVVVKGKKSSEGRVQSSGTATATATQNIQHPTPNIQRPSERHVTAPAAEAAKAPWDEVYVATAATGEKIPHPLSRKTRTEVLPNGQAIDVPQGMVYIPAGEFKMGEKESEHQVYLDAFFIGKYEVTNAEWKAFVDLASFEPPPPHWKDGKIPVGKENHPVVDVSWEDAQKYCEFMSRLMGGRVSLATEAQWENAARGPEAYIYPWGNQWDKDLCNSGYLLAQFGFRPIDESDDWKKKWDEWLKSAKGREIIAAGGNTTPVGSFPNGKSFYGCYDMAGNAHEWCADWFTTNYFKLKDARRNPEGPTEEEAEEKNFWDKKMKARVVRGGSWSNFGWAPFRAVSRSGYTPSHRSAGNSGFRVAVSMAAPRVAQPQPVIARSDISAEAFAKAEEGFVSLFNGKDLTGWRLRNAAKPNGWSVQDGALVNTPPSGNLLTEQQFSDFQLRCELQLPPGGNSGVYLRGRHEVQIGDDFGGRAYPASSGGICGMIAPSENAARPAGEWQTLDITLIGRKVTVVLNGKTVVSDGELTRPTIGALDQDMDRPGPIMLQGIFTAVSFRNIRIRPIGTAAGAPAAEPAEPGFVSLFNGKDLEGWVVMGDPKRWSVSDGVLRCDGPKASDWLRSTREYGDFILKLDCRLSEKGNSGVWLRAPATKNLGALQVQLMTDPYPDPKLANAALTKIAAPEPLTPAAPNVWHSFEVQCIGHRYVVIMDGTKMVDVSSDQAPALESKPLKGYIGLEESWSGPEGYVEFRNIRIKPLGGEVKAPDDAEALQRLGQSFFNSAGGEMVYIPPGEFMMGSTPEERAWASQPENGGARPDRLRREGEQPRPTKIRQGFWMGRTEVTVRQWKQFVDETGYVTNAEKSGSAMASSGKVGQNATVKGASWRQPGFPTADDSPASCMSWDDATAFCDWLNQRKVEAKSLPAGYRFRLPTEAEWEYACRGGRQGTKFWWGDSKEDGKGRLNWAGAEDGFEYVSPVDHYGERGRNGFGLADMLGNVNEWCLDSYDFKGAHEEFYAGNSRDRVARGGAYPQDPAANRCACRSFWAKDGCFINNGFRVCCGVDPANATAPAGAASAQQKP